MSSIKEKALATINHKIYCDETGEHFWDDGSRYETAKALIEALKVVDELVALKTLKDEQGKTPDYLERQPVAWEKARNFLEKCNRGDFKESEQ